jgi:secreted trypsin-like serine protease
MKKILTLSAVFVCLFFSKAIAQQPWIVGGGSAQEGQFPWIADMRVAGSHQCGSSLIAPGWVITAAHCAYDPFTMQPLDTTGVRFRFNTVRTEGPINPNGGIERSVKKFFIHPSFDMDEFFSNGNDIALVQLMEPVTSITPIALPALSDSTTVYATGYPVKIAGWGLQDTTTFTSPDTMKFCSTKVFDFTLCKDIVGELTTRAFCAGYKSGEDEAGAAAGDSGGPVWVEPGGNKKIIGLVSGGVLPYTSVDTPGVFTKVALFRPWIDSIMNANGGGPTDIDKTPWNEEHVKVGQGINIINLFFAAINSNSVHCEIYSAEGKKIYTTLIQSPSFRNYSLDTHNFAKGMYVIRITDPAKGKYYARKVMIP